MPTEVLNCADSAGLEINACKILSIILLFTCLHGSGSWNQESEFISIVM